MPWNGAKDNAYTTVASLASAGASSVTVADATRLPALTTGNPTFRVELWDSTTYSEPGEDPNSEVQTVTTVVGNVLTLLGTLAHDHAVGQRCANVFDAASYNALTAGIDGKLPTGTTTAAIADSAGKRYVPDPDLPNAFDLVGVGVSGVESAWHSHILFDHTVEPQPLAFGGIAFAGSNSGLASIGHAHAMPAAPTAASVQAIPLALGTAKGSIPIFSAAGTIAEFLAGAAAGKLTTDGSGNWTVDTAVYLTSLTGAVLTDQTAPQTIGATGSRLANLYASAITATQGQIDNDLTLLGNLTDGSHAFNPSMFDSHTHNLTLQSLVLTSAADWAGTLVNTDTATSSGDVLLSSYNLKGYAQASSTSKMATAYNSKLKIFKATGLTIDFAIRQPSANLNNGAIYNGPVGGNQGWYAVMIGNAITSKVIFRLNRSTTEGAGQVTSVASIPVNALTRVRCSWDGTTMKIFINGVLDNSQPYSTDITYGSNDGLTVGNYWDGSASNYGIIADLFAVRISKTIRDGGTDYTPIDDYTTDADTVALYNFTNQSGTSVTDASGNGITGTLSGTTSWLNKTCYQSKGTDTIDHDFGATSTWGTAAWTATVPTGTLVKIRTKSAATQAGLTAATWSSYITTSGSAIVLTAQRWLRMEWYLATTDAYATPTLSSGTITFTPSSGQGGALDHTNLSNIGTNTHAQIDAALPKAILAALGDTIYGGAAGAPTKLVGNITTGKQVLSQTGDGANSAAPVWAGIVQADVAGLLTSSSPQHAGMGLGKVRALAVLDILANATAQPCLHIQDVPTDATNKIGGITCGHYTNAEEPVLGFWFSNISTGGRLIFGGGGSTFNCVKSHLFYAAADGTTLTGTNVAIIDINGLHLGTNKLQFGSAIGTDDAAANLYRSGASVVKTDAGFQALLGFGCNSKTPQTAYASGGAVTTGAGTFGFTSDAQRSSLTTLVANIRLALIANGIMS